MAPFQQQLAMEQWRAGPGCVYFLPSRLVTYGSVVPCAAGATGHARFWLWRIGSGGYYAHRRHEDLGVLWPSGHDRAAHHHHGERGPGACAVILSFRGRGASPTVQAARVFERQGRSAAVRTQEEAAAREGQGRRGAGSGSSSSGCGSGGSSSGG